MVESSGSEIVTKTEAVKASVARPFVVVGIPAFNEEKTIATVVLKAQKYADKVVVCDDGSTDMTGEIAKKLDAEVVRHEQNLGYGAAIQSLFKWAKRANADIMVTLDGDGQHDPAEIPRVVKPVVDGEAEIVIGSRFVDKHLARVMPWYRRAGVGVITKLARNSSKLEVRDAQSGFRAYRCKALEKLSLFEDGMGVSTEILLNGRKCGLRIKEVPASCSYSSSLKTSSRHPLRHGLEVVMSIVRLIVEDRPLLCLGLPGLVMLIAGTFFGVWMLKIYASSHRIVTNVALASIAFILIGLFILFAAVTLYAISRLGHRINSNKSAA